MSVKIRNAARQRGAVLVLITFIGVASLILGVSIIYAGLQGRILSIRNVELLQAKVASDAGISHAFDWMTRKLHDPNEPHWDNSVFPYTSNTVTLPASGGQFSYVITHISNFTISGDPNGFRIVSTGTYAGRSYTSTCEIEAQLIYAGILAADEIKLFGEFLTDPENKGQDFLIQSNSTESVSIALKPGTAVPGDVVVGPGVAGDPVEEGIVSVQPGSTVAGDVYSGSDYLDFPPVPIPDTTGTVDIGAIQKTTTLDDPSLTRIYTSEIDISDGDTLTIEHDTFIHVGGKVHIGNDSGINIAPGAQVVIYVEGFQNGINREAVYMGNSAWIEVAGALELDLFGDLVGQNSTGILNLSGSTTNVSLLGIYDEILGIGTQHIDVKAGTNTDMTIYAPYADIVIYNEGEFKGSLVGKSLETKQFVEFTYDTSLADGSIDHFSAYFVRTRWWG